MVVAPASEADRSPTRDITKKARLTAQEADLLAEIAEAKGLSESEVLREGIRLQARMRQRAENIHQLIELIEGPEPEKVRFELEV